MCGKDGRLVVQMNKCQLSLVEGSRHTHPSFFFAFVHTEVIEATKRREAHTDLRSADFSSNRVNGFQQEALTVGDGATVLVCPSVKCAAQELVEEEAVGCHDFDTVKAGVDGHPCGLHEVSDDALHFFSLQGAWCARLNRA